jgi:hypothetical protein
MNQRSLIQIAAIGAALALGGCASTPARINDVCAVFAQNDGWVTNWQKSARKSEQKYGVPVPVLMATIRKESGFKHNARPPRKYYLGFIPGKRASSAYGYSQALDGTWQQYVVESGNYGAKRQSFDDAVDFVGWYHAKTAATYGVSPGDTFNLYLAYHEGWAAYGKGRWRSDAGLMAYARSTAEMAVSYDAQLRQCGG